MFALHDSQAQPATPNPLGRAAAAQPDADTQTKKPPRSSSIGKILRSLGGIMDNPTLSEPLLERSVLWILHAYRVPMDGVIPKKTIEAAWNYTGFRHKDLPTLLQRLATRGDIDLVVNDQRQALIRLNRLGFNRIHLTVAEPESQKIRNTDDDPAYSGLRSDPFSSEKRDAAGNLAIQRFFHAPMGLALRRLGFFEQPDAGVSLAVQTLLRMIEQFPEGFDSGFTRNDLGAAWARLGLRLKDLDDSLELMTKEKLIIGKLSGNQPVYRITARGEREIRRYHDELAKKERNYQQNELARHADKGLLKEMRYNRWKGRLPFIEKFGEYGLIVVAFVLAAWVFTLPVESYVEVGNAILSSNGSGTRSAMRDEPDWVGGLYDVEFFVKKPSDTATAVLAQPGPKRIVVTANRDLRDGKIVRLLLNEVRRYLPPSDYATLFQEASVLDNAIKAHGVEGAQLIADYIPGRGLAMWIDEHPVLHLNNEALFLGLMKIWIGDHAPDASLKRKLLGDRFGFKISTTPT